MDTIDREKFSAAYQILADVFERDRSADQVEGHLSYILGDLMRRVFVGSEFTPPDEILEMAANVLRSGDAKARKEMAHRLRRNAAHLDQLSES
jgi:hypothetical protein